MKYVGFVFFMQGLMNALIILLTWPETTTFIIERFLHANTINVKKGNMHILHGKHCHRRDRKFKVFYLTLHCYTNYNFSFPHFQQVSMFTNYSKSTI